MSGQTSSFRFQWQLAIRDDGSLRFREKAVAWGLSLRMDVDGGSCFPTIETIAADVGAAPSTVKKARVELQKAGYLDYREGHGPDNPTQYQAALPPKATKSRETAVSERAGRRPFDDPKSRETAHKRAGRRPLSRQEGDNGAPATSLSSEDEQAFASLVEPLRSTRKQRSELRAAFTESPDGFRRVLGEAVAQGDPPIALLLTKVRAGDHRGGAHTPPRRDPVDLGSAAAQWYAIVGASMPARSFKEELDDWRKRGLDENTAAGLDARYEQEHREEAA